MASLNTIAAELLISILEYLTTQNLLRIERTCKAIRLAAKTAYRASYGTQVCHRDAGHRPDFRCLAVEQLKYDMDIDHIYWSPTEAMRILLEDCYLCTALHLREVATDVLLSAGRGRDRPEWNEAVATALMAQARFSEAEAKYRMLMKSTPLPERTFLTAARFGWPFGFRYPNSVSRNLSEQAFLGASAAGNKDLLENLHRHGIPWNIRLQSQNAAVIAAQTGQIHILEYLREQGFDILASPDLQEEEAPLFHAIRYGEVEAADYLLQAGAPLIDDYLWRVAEGRDINMIKYIISQRPDFVKACSPHGSLVVEYFFDSNISADECENLLRLFIEVDSFNIDNKGRDGQSAIHLAAKAGRSDICQLLVSFGADIKALDNTGMSVIDIASVGHNELIRWLEEQITVNWDQFMGQKSMHAGRIIKSQRRLHLEILLVGGYADYFAGDTFDEKMESARSRWDATEMDKQLIMCWVSAYSAAALEEYANSFLGSRTEILLHRISLVINSAWQKGKITPELDDVQQTHFPQACKVVSTMNPILRGRPSALQELAAAKHVAHGFTINEIEEIDGYLQSSLGVMMRAGSERKYMEQHFIMSRFLGLFS